MKINQFSAEALLAFEKLVGARFTQLFSEGGRLEMGNGMTLDGGGLITMTFVKEHTYYLLRLKFHAEEAGYFFTEFHEITEADHVKKSQLIKNLLYLDSPAAVEGKLPHLSIGLEPKFEEGEDHIACKTIKSIKIYHYEFQWAGDEENPEEEYDYVAFIDIETLTGRRIIIEEEDPFHAFLIYIDNPRGLNSKLNEIHDDQGKTFGKSIYQLRHHFC